MMRMEVVVYVHGTFNVDDDDPNTDPREALLRALHDAGYPDARVDDVTEGTREELEY